MTYGDATDRASQVRALPWGARPWTATKLMSRGLTSLAGGVVGQGPHAAAPHAVLELRDLTRIIIYIGIFIGRFFEPCSVCPRRKGILHRCFTPVDAPSSGRHTL